MTRFTWLVLLLPSLAFAKGPTFGDLVTSVQHAPVVIPGQQVEVVVTVDLDGFCNRAMPDDAAFCQELAEQALLGHPELIWMRDGYEPAGFHDVEREVRVPMQQGADGLWRGSVTLVPLLLPGSYNLFRVYTTSLLPLPTLTVVPAAPSSSCSPSSR